MDDALVVALVAVMTLVVLDALVVAGLVVARKLAGARAARRRRRTPRPLSTATLGTVLHTLPDGHDPAPAMSALAYAGYAVLVDPEHPQILLISCPDGESQREEVRSVLARESQRTSRTPGLGWLDGSIRFTDGP